MGATLRAGSSGKPIGEIGGPDLRSFKGVDGELDAATNILDSDLSIQQMRRVVHDSSGKQITDIDIELSNGDAVEVKNVDFSEYDPDGTFTQRHQYEKLEKKMITYADARAEVGESLNGDRIIVTARGNPNNNPALDDLAETTEQKISDNYGWDVEVTFKSIDELEGL